MSKIVRTTEGATINGVLPSAGDIVYDILRKYGTIVHVESDYSFTVEFATGARQRYSSGGLIGGCRRIYWKDPVIVDPTKDSENWDTFTDIAQTIYQKLGV